VFISPQADLLQDPEDPRAACVPHTRYALCPTPPATDGMAVERRITAKPQLKKVLLHHAVFILMLSPQFHVFFEKQR
jgi:hypothetical protein